MSCRQSLPITRALRCRPWAPFGLFRNTVTLEAPSTTWQFVTMTPSERTMNPVPTPRP
jgi:hypothetical protein